MYNSEFAMMQMLLGGTSQWPTLLMMLFVFLVVVFRRASIEQLLLFRFGVFLLALSIVFSTVFPSLQMQLMGSRDQLFDSASIILRSGGVVMFAGAMLCIVYSMLPSRFRAKPVNSPAPPVKHPLDD